jgi:ribosomal protein L37E
MMTARAREPDPVDEGPSPEDLDRFNVPTIACRGCGRQTYDDAERCAHCGRSFLDADSPRMPTWAFFAAGTLLVVLIVLALGGVPLF